MRSTVTTTDIAATYAAVGCELIAEAVVDPPRATATVAYMGVVTRAAYWWRRGGRASDADGAVSALVSDLAAADLITAAASRELGPGGRRAAAVWMDRHFDEIAERAEAQLEANGGSPAAPVVDLLGLHPDMVAAASVHRRAAQLIALDEPGCSGIADAAICGAAAEARQLHDLAGRRAGHPLEVAQLMLLDPVVRTAVWERGGARALYLWRWIDGVWATVRQRASIDYGIGLWEREGLG